MALTILVTSSPTILTGKNLVAQLTKLCQQQQIVQIFFLAEGLFHTFDSHVMDFLGQLTHAHQTTAAQSQPVIALGYCPSSAARHVPDYHSEIVEDYGLTQFYALIHNSDKLEQI